MIKLHLMKKIFNLEIIAPYLKLKKILKRIVEIKNKLANINV
jgi:hypothetical protein